MRILIASDKFKGILSAREAAQAIANGIRDVLPAAEIELAPVADGGEGTAEILGESLGGRSLNVQVHDALGRLVQAKFAWVAEQSLALFDMSEAAGLWRIDSATLNPEKADTFGVGELMLAAAAHGARKILLGLGGSATNDGGWGMARALGYRFLRRDGTEVENVPQLRELSQIVPPSSGSFERLLILEVPAGAGGPGTVERVGVEVVALSDVRNPLLGENGATRVFGRQKGIGAQEVSLFEVALQRLADVSVQTFGSDHRNEVGAGAAGGLGFGLMTFCSAKVRPGFSTVAEYLRLRERMEGADLVVTGEGQLDQQTFSGKAAAGVAEMARELGKRCFAVVGRVTPGLDWRELFQNVIEASPGEVPRNVEEAKARLREAGRGMFEV